MNRQLISFLIIILLAALMASCQSKPKPHVDRSVDYENARSIPPLRVQ